MSRNKRIVKLEEELNLNYSKARALGYNAIIYKQILNKNVGNPISTIETILNKEYKINKPLDGFGNLVEKGHIDLTLEYTVYKKGYRTLLNQQQKMVVVSLLHEYGKLKFKEIENIK